MLLIEYLLSEEEIILKFREIYEFKFVFGHEFFVIPETTEFLENNICRFFLVVFSNDLGVFKREGVVGCQWLQWRKGYKIFSFEYLKSLCERWIKWQDFLSAICCNWRI